MYGKGITYTKIVPENLHNFEYDKTVAHDIEHHLYDLIIYGSFHRGTPFWENVHRSYKPDEVVLFCGEDEHVCCHKKFTDMKHNVFVREKGYFLTVL